jgi:hypothetical protein
LMEREGADERVEAESDVGVFRGHCVVMVHAHPKLGGSPGMMNALAADLAVGPWRRHPPHGEPSLVELHDFLVSNVASLTWRAWLTGHPVHDVEPSFVEIHGIGRERSAHHRVAFSSRNER